MVLMIRQYLTKKIPGIYKSDYILTMIVDDNLGGAKTEIPLSQTKEYTRSIAIPN